MEIGITREQADKVFDKLLSNTKQTTDEIHPEIVFPALLKTNLHIVEKYPQHIALCLTTAMLRLMAEDETTTTS